MLLQKEIITSARKSEVKKIIKALEKGEIEKAKQMLETYYDLVEDSWNEASGERKDRLEERMMLVEEAISELEDGNIKECLEVLEEILHET